MGVAERQALAHQVVGQVRRRGKARLRRGAHGVWIWLHGGDDVGHGAQAVEQRVGGIEQRLLVFLIVAVVGQWLPLHQHQQRVQIADRAPGLAAHQLGHVWVLLLRHDARTRAVGVRQRHEAPLRRSPHDEFLAPARQVDGGDAGGGAELQGEVAVAHGVQGVSRRCVEAEFGGGLRAVDWKGGAGQRRAAERRDVQPPPAIAEAVAVACGHLEPGQQVVGEEDGLRGLQVREAGHDRFHMVPCQRDQRSHHAGQPFVDGVDAVAQPQADVRGHLVVARTAGVQLLAGVADERCQAVLDVHVDILERRVPCKAAGVDFFTDGRQSIDDGAVVLGVEGADLEQHVGVGDGALDVVVV